MYEQMNWLAADLYARALLRRIVLYDLAIDTG